MGEVTPISKKQPDVFYSVNIRRSFDDSLSFSVSDVADDERSRMAVADDLQRVVDMLKEADNG